MKPIIKCWHLDHWLEVVGIHLSRVREMRFESHDLLANSAIDR
jgi:hypothetical protein